MDHKIVRLSAHRRNHARSKQSELAPIRARRSRQAFRLSHIRVEVVVFLLAVTACAAYSVAELRFASFAPGSEIPLSAPATARVAVQKIRVIDGDTIEVDGVRHRLLHWDTPEISGDQKCWREYELGIQARNVLQAWITSAGTLTYNGSEIDRYGRRLSQWQVDGQDVGSFLASQGLARRWHYGHTAKPDWCT